jgi:hypothetical protein
MRPVRPAPDVTMTSASAGHQGGVEVRGFEPLISSVRERTRVVTAHPPGAVVRQQGTAQDEPVAVAGDVALRYRSWVAWADPNSTRSRYMARRRVSSV